MALTRGKAAAITKEGLAKEYEQRGQYNPEREDWLSSEVKRLQIQDNSEEHIRPVPPYSPDGVAQAWGLVVHVHYGVGGEGGSAICLQRQFGQPCPVCEEQKDMWEVDRELAKRMYPQARVIANVIQRTTPEPEDKGVQIIDMPKQKLYDEILNLCRDRETGAIINVSDVVNGHGVYFTKERKGRGSFPDYVGIQIGRTPSDVSALMGEGSYNLQELLVPKTYEELKQLFDSRFLLRGGGDGKPQEKEPTKPEAPAAAQQQPAAAQQQPPAQAAVQDEMVALHRRMEELKQQAAGAQAPLGQPAPGDPGTPLPQGGTKPDDDGIPF